MEPGPSEAQRWTVSVSSDTSGSLYPGIGSETLTYSVTNSGGGNQELNSVNFSVANSGQGGACLGSWFTVTDNGSTNGVVPAGANSDLAPGHSDNGTVTLSLRDVATSQDACEGASPQVTLTAG